MSTDKIRFQSKTPYPTNIKSLYRRFTSADAPEEELEKALNNESARRQLIVRDVLAGVPVTIIAERMEIKRGTIRSVLRETMWAMLKKMHKLPRYHQKGRPKGRNYGGRRKRNCGHDR